MSAFENEVFEDTETLPNPAEELRQKTTDALYAEVPEARGKLETIVAMTDYGNQLKEAIINVPEVPARKSRVKRTEAEMIAALGGSALKEANYVTDRVQKLEDKISELLGSVSQKARELILADHPHLSRY